MSADQDTPRGRRSLGTDRLAAFSDGVLAIAATLLVLDIVVQPPGTLLQQVLRAWPGAQRKLLPATIGYVIAIAIGLLLPRAAVALYFCLAVFLIVPFREMARLLFRGSRQFLRCWAATTKARCRRSSSRGRVRCSCSTACCGSTHDGPFG